MSLFACTPPHMSLFITNFGYPLPLNLVTSSWNNPKAFFIIFNRLSLKEIETISLKVESLTLNLAIVIAIKIALVLAI